MDQRILENSVMCENSQVNDFASKVFRYLRFGASEFVYIYLNSVAFLLRKRKLVQCISYIRDDSLYQVATIRKVNYNILITMCDQICLMGSLSSKFFLVVKCKLDNLKSSHCQENA